VAVEAELVRRSYEESLSQNWNHTQKQDDRRQDHSTVFAGCLRWRLPDWCTHCLLVFSALRNRGTRLRYRFLRGAYPERLLASRSGVACLPDRPC